MCKSLEYSSRVVFLLLDISRFFSLWIVSRHNYPSGSSEVLISGHGCVSGLFPKSVFRTDSLGILLVESPLYVSLSVGGFFILGSSDGSWVFVGDGGCVLSCQGDVVCGRLVACCGVSVGMGVGSARERFGKTWSSKKSGLLFVVIVKWNWKVWVVPSSSFKDGGNFVWN
nr:hypothetical protein [Tanacetum cinerariifolium]